MLRPLSQYALTCSQCGREAPTSADELISWKHGELALAGTLDDVAEPMLLCPACAAEDEAHDYEEGSGG
jgi:hypothetical protein